MAAAECDINRVNHSAGERVEGCPADDGQCRAELKDECLSAWPAEVIYPVYVTVEMAIGIRATVVAWP